MLDKIALPIWVSGLWLTSSAVIYGSYRFAQRRAKKKIEQEGYCFTHEPGLKEKIGMFTIASIPLTRITLLKEVYNEEKFNNLVLKNGLKNKIIVKTKS